VSAISAAREAPVSYVIGRYVGGILLDEIAECPLSDGCGCDVVRHDRRKRKTGPLHRLVVLRCRVHAITFTVYPPDFRPFARRALVKARATFDARPELEVVDLVADAPVLPPPKSKVDGLSWSSLLRMVGRMARLFGFEDARACEVIALVTGLNLGDLAQAARARGARAIATAIGKLRRRVSVDAMLDLGGQLGLWRPPRRWESQRCLLVALSDPRGPPSSLDCGR